MYVQLYTENRSCGAENSYIMSQSAVIHQSGCASLQVQSGTGASQSQPGSPPIGAPGGAPGAGITCPASAGRTRKRLMSAASRELCARSASPLQIGRAHV